MIISKSILLNFIILLSKSSTEAFTTKNNPLPTKTRIISQKYQTLATASSQDNNNDVVLYSDDDSDYSLNDGLLDGADDDKENMPWKKNPRWNSLSPNVKNRIVQEAQQRAIRNKKKREPSADKKQRMMMYYKKAQMASKRASRTERPLPLKSPDRIPLSSIEPNQILTGTVISFTPFGAYIDVKSECDGLLHVSQITRKTFVEHPRQVLTAGEEVEVKVHRVSADVKKLQLTMLGLDENDVDDLEIMDRDDADDADEGLERIPLSDLDVNDELWGQITRVTSYGAYVELGTTVRGWLHFMDHPEFEFGKKPADFLRVGDRIRCWVVSVEEERERLKLTTMRPEDLPGPRREFTKTL